ncbi:suppressor of fused domain protein [Lysobacter korlensis]|uniref:Suppressor of fused domain protein n=1 Tax=Lysobacter korlensis TaxID=553636 RepID=A0ABV6S135_9GAMM
MSSLEEVWEFREATLYPSLFGEVESGIYVLDPEDFVALGATEYDPRWLHLGVFVFRPTESRKSWLYVTSGGSTPWETTPDEYSPEEYSWLGVELVLEAPSKAEWPIRVLKRMLAFHVLAARGHFGDRPGLDYGARLPLGGPIAPGTDSALQFAMVAAPEHYPATSSLASGKFDFLHVVGISESERDFAKDAGHEELVRKLSAAAAFPVTDPQRASVTG